MDDHDLSGRLLHHHVFLFLPGRWPDQHIGRPLGGENGAQIRYRDALSGDGALERACPGTGVRDVPGKRESDAEGRTTSDQRSNPRDAGAADRDDNLRDRIHRKVRAA